MLWCWHITVWIVIWKEVCGGRGSEAELSACSDQPTEPSVKLSRVYSVWLHTWEGHSVVSAYLKVAQWPSSMKFLVPKSILLKYYIPMEGCKEKGVRETLQWEATKSQEQLELYNPFFRAWIMQQVCRQWHLNVLTVLEAARTCMWWKKMTFSIGALLMHVLQSC